MSLPASKTAAFGTLVGHLRRIGLATVLALATAALPAPAFAQTSHDQANAPSVLDGSYRPGPLLTQR